MRWLRIVLAGLLALVALFVLGMVALYLAQPTSYRIARTRTVSAAPDAVAAHLTDVRAFVAWEPWAPAPGEHPIVTFSPTTSGVGAWVERRVGSSASRVTLTEVAPDHVVFANVTEGALGGGASEQRFDLRAAPGGGTEITWALSGELHALPRMLWPFVQLERRVGPEMDAALGRLDHASCAAEP